MEDTRIDTEEDKDGNGTDAVPAIAQVMAAVLNLTHSNADRKSVVRRVQKKVHIGRRRSINADTITTH